MRSGGTSTLESRRALLYSVLAGAHLALVCCGAFSWPVETIPGVGRFLGFYSRNSLASTSYGFFAHSFGGALRVSYSLSVTSEPPRKMYFDTDSNPEASLRMSVLLAVLLKKSTDPIEFQRIVLASLAGSVLESRPDASGVRIEVESFNVPTMAEYRAGMRGEWVNRYRADFQKRENRREVAR
jgi:hypothetical protein